MPDPIVIDNFPYTNFQELNISWILDKLRELEERVAALEEEEP